MKKIILALLTAMLLLPACALATTVEISGTDLSAGGSWITDVNGLPIPAAGDAWTIRYDPATCTLTLNSANVTAPHMQPCLTAVGDLNIVLVPGSSNVLIGGDVPRPAEGETWEASWGISVNGDLTISGAGSLTAVAGMGGSSYGIIVLNHGGNGATLTITDATVMGVGGYAGAFSKGVYSHQAMTLENATLTATADESGYYSYGLDAAPLTAKNSVITVTAGQADYHSLGVYGSMYLTDCTVSVKADPNSPYSNALCGNLTMSGGEAEFLGASAAIALSKADGLSVAPPLEITGAATYDGELGAVTLPAGEREFLAGDAKAQRIVIRAAEQDKPNDGGEAPAIPAPPVTGDGATPVLWLTLLIFAGAAVLAAKRRYN